MHQKDYIQTLLEDYNLLDCNAVSMPMETLNSLSASGSPCKMGSEFQALMGQLLYVLRLGLEI